MSDRGRILSGQLIAEPGTGPREAKGGRINTDAEDGSDLPGLEMLPCPEVENLPIVLTEVIQGGGEFGVRTEFGGVGLMSLWLRPETFHETQMPLPSPSAIRQRVTGDAVAPGEHALVRYVVDPSPDGEEHVGQDVLGLVDVDASSQVSLKRIENFGDNGLEALSSLLI